MSDFLGKSRIANAAAIKTNVGSFGTRIRYWNAFDRFCLFCEKEFHCQKVQNISAKHVYAYVEKLKSKGLTAKGNVRKAEAILKERMEAFELELKQKQADKSNEDILFSKFLSNWLAMVKSTLLITTYGGYQYFIEQRINPYFDEKKMTLQKITTKDIQE